MYERNQKQGYVYLLRSENGFYKIGIAKDVKRRLGDLLRQFPINIGIIHQIYSKDRRVVEKFLHKKFADKRVQYEWFNLNPEDVNWFTSLNNGDLDYVI